MGLDTFAARTPKIELTEEDVAAFEDAQPKLAGGIAAGGWESFRGKLYDDVVQRVTRMSLYELWIPPEIVQKMSEAFDRCDPEAVSREAEDATYPTSAHEVVELRRFFRICADRGLGLVGWW
jgi:hypothetical protein